VACDGKVFLFVDRGKKRGWITCLDAKSGNVVREGDLAKAPSASYASPILVGNKLCCAREDGTVIIAEVKKDGVGKIVKTKWARPLLPHPL
tara:strand:- start:18 stop:290 length:273 start_codon:yes stop_codon:yes gene_type:complete